MVSDGETRFTYRVDKRPYRTLPGDVGVIDPPSAPLNRDAEPYDRPGRHLTLTTCEGEGGSSRRLIVRAHPDAGRPAAEGPPEALPDLPD